MEDRALSSLEGRTGFCFWVFNGKDIETILDLWCALICWLTASGFVRRTRSAILVSEGELSQHRLASNVAHQLHSGDLI